ncbi:MAG: outer membrane beta-barrel protein [Bdellovibrionales bacterium]
MLKKLLFLSFLLFSLGTFAQGEADPFIDYSEFEVASEEEADVNFFRNGRFLTLALAVNNTSFTSVMGEYQSPAANVGLNISYFFDLRIALQIALSRSSHAYLEPGSGITGTLNQNSTQVSGKYFFNMQNVTKGLSNWNPYLIGGISSIHRDLTRNTGDASYGQDSGIGFHIGGGIEIPIARNKMFLGLETKYTMINFEGEAIANDNTGDLVEGDILDFGVNLGINF